MQVIKNLREYLAPYTRRQLLALKLIAAVLALMLAFPPWLTCARFAGGGCKELPPYGWGFLLTIFSDDTKAINYLLLVLEVALLIAVATSLIKRFRTAPQSDAQKAHPTDREL
jgi:ABC-type multidrug transport system fused ATPase/permease subunit